MKITWFKIRLALLIIGTLSMIIFGIRDFANDNLRNMCFDIFFLLSYIPFWIWWIQDLKK